MAGRYVPPLLRLFLSESVLSVHIDARGAPVDLSTRGVPVTLVTRVCGQRGVNSNPSTFQICTDVMTLTLAAVPLDYRDQNRRRRRR